MSEPGVEPYSLPELRALDAEGVGMAKPRKGFLALMFVGVALIFAGWILESDGGSFPFYMLGAFLLFLVGLKWWGRRKAAAAADVQMPGTEVNGRRALAERLHDAVNRRIDAASVNMVVLLAVGLGLVFHGIEVTEQMAEGEFAWQDWVGDLGIVLVLGSIGVTGCLDHRAHSSGLKDTRDRLWATVRAAASELPVGSPTDPA
ncbi:MAG: hypothetical protein ACYTG4_00600 [Planctomycetota bacterium]|jgi:hypothetical protein